jgi:hypothetical protein
MLAVIVLFALIGGWIVLWKFAAGKAEETLNGWRAREAQAGRAYACGTQTVGGFPFRIVVACDNASAVFHDRAPPFAIKTQRIEVAAEVYRPTVLSGTFTGPLTVADPGQPPVLAAKWRRGTVNLQGLPASPERVTLSFEGPTLDRVDGNARRNLFSAKHFEVTGRLIGGSVTDKPVVELSLRLDRGSLPGLHPAAIPPIDADIAVRLRGLQDFKPKPWPQRFRDIQAANGRIEITRGRVQQGETIATGTGALSLTADGYLQGQVRVTVAGLEPFLKAIGAAQMVQKSQGMDKLAGFLDRLSPGLGDVARREAGANLAAGINMLGQPATLEGKSAVALPLRFEQGAVFLGPIPIGRTPPLF